MSSGGDFIHWSEALVFFDCPHCNGTGIDPIRVGIGDEHPCDPVDCTRCGGMMLEAVCLGTFLSNLAVAGALCAAWFHAFGVGFDSGWEDCRRLGSIAALHPTTHDYWRPGCSRPCPGWRES